MLVVPLSAAMADSVPSMSSEVQTQVFNMGGSGFVNLWQQALRLQASLAGQLTAGAEAPSKACRSVNSRG